MSESHKNTFGTQVPLSLNVEYTAPVDGYVFGQIEYNAGNYCYITVNGITLIAISSSTQGNSGVTRSSVYVRKGSKIKVIRVNGTWSANFVPFA